MPTSWRRLLTGLALFLAAGVGIGWLYDRPAAGLLAASLLALAWQVRKLLTFDRAVRTGVFDQFRHGEGIWQQLFASFSHERERASEYRERYRDLLREVRKSIRAMPDGAVVIDGNNEIVMCNKAAKRLAGIKPKKDRGQRVDNILRNPGLTELLGSNDYARSQEIPSPLHDDVWLDCRVVPYGADQKLLLLRDVTDRIRLNTMRRDFVANASHELRSPLTVISGYLDSLAEDADIPGDWKNPVGQMQIQAQRMNGIVADLLHLSRLENAGKAGLDEVVDVVAIMAAARKSCAESADAAPIRLLPESKARLRGNRSEIESVVMNLLSNAVRHTPRDGEIKVIWRSDRDAAELIVRDTGEGIPKADVPRLTERFFRVDRGRSRDDGGTGLGLSIVKHVLSRHDAELGVESEPGAGSEFRCRFPSRRVVISSPIQLERQSRRA